MQKDYETAGATDVRFVTLNGAGTEAGLATYTQNMDSPVLQDTAADGVWGRFGAAKDDTVIADKTGQAVRHFRGAGQLILPADAARLRSEIDRLR